MQTIQTPYSYLVMYSPANRPAEVPAGAYYILVATDDAEKAMRRYLEHKYANADDKIIIVQQTEIKLNLIGGGDGKKKG